MAIRAWVAGVVLAAAMAAPSRAQEQVWIQVEALPTLDRATDSAEGYAGQIEGVSGYALGSGWYGVVLGPFARPDAEALLARLSTDGLLPSDAFIVDGAKFEDRFWPAAAAPAAPGAPADPVAALDAAPPAAAPAPLPPETLEEARASEAAMTQGQKEQLQVALQWAGVYSGGIDGAYGRGTRTAMAAWQAQNGFEATGILTTAQRAALMGAYNGILEGLGLETVTDEAAGIEVRVPRAVLGAPEVDPPFVRFEATDGSVAQLILISQPGDLDTLYGLYEIMQTLEAVPEQGPRERGERSFVIDGTDATRQTHVEATLADGSIKGFALVWPAGDQERLARLLPEIHASFRRLPGVLDPQAGTPSEEQSVDLVSGLEIRQPKATASGFFVDGLGTVVTTAASVASCERVTIDAGIAATVAFTDPALGLAVLEPAEELAPRAVAAFQADAPRLDAEVAVAGFPYGAALARPVFSFGRLADLRGLDGEEEVRRLEIAARAGDAGGPVFDAGGAVLGMLLPAGAGDAVLPEGTAYALDAQAIVAALTARGITPATTPTTPSISPERLTREAAPLAVLVSCW